MVGLTGYISNLEFSKALHSTHQTSPPTHELEVIGDTNYSVAIADSAGAEATGKSITVNGDAAASTFFRVLKTSHTAQVQGVTTFDTQGYFVPPSGTTEQEAEVVGFWLVGVIQLYFNIEIQTQRKCTFWRITLQERSRMCY